MAPSSRTLHPRRWQSILNLADKWCETNQLPCIAIMTGTKETIAGKYSAGRQTSDGPVPLSDDAIFLVASITKPIVATAILQLVERGQLTLADRVVDYIPEFGREGKYGVEVRHLLTHTSGLPDMLPDNLELRQAHASLQQFSERTEEFSTRAWDFPFSVKFSRGLREKAAPSLFAKSCFCRLACTKQNSEPLMDGLKVRRLACRAYPPRFYRNRNEVESIGTGTAGTGGNLVLPGAAC